MVLSILGIGNSDAVCIVQLKNERIFLLLQSSQAVSVLPLVKGLVYWASMNFQ